LSNTALIFKTLLYSVCVFIVIAAIGVGILVPTLKPLYDEIVNGEAIERLVALLNDLVSGVTHLNEAVAEIGDIYESVIGVINEHNGEIFFSYGMIIFLAFLAGFFRSSFDVSTSLSVNDYMSSKLRGKLIPGYFLRISQSFVYSVMRTLISGGATVVFIAILSLFIRLMAPYINFLSFTLAIAAGICMFSIKFAVLSEWMPNIICGDKVMTAFKKSVKGSGGFKEKFLSAICLYTVFAVAAFSFTLPTFGVALLILLPAHTCMLRISELVNHYTASGKKFYIDDFTIINPERKTV
jgi:hypothetical protein